MKVANRVVVLLFGFAGLSVAATFTVNSTADVVDSTPGNGVCETATGNGVCTLRAAVQEAGATSGPNTISVPAGTYLLSATPVCAYSLVNNHTLQVENLSALCVGGNVTITGAGSDLTIIDAGGATGATCCGSYPSARGMVISYGAQVRISGISIQNGRASGGYAWVGGGNINNQGSLTISDSVLTDGIGIVGGGGIWNDGTLFMQHVTLSGNSAGAYGGAGLYNTATAELANCTLDTNVSGNLGGGIMTSGSLKVLSSAIVNNVSSSNGAGIYNDYGSVALTNVTIAGNHGANGAGIWNYQFGTLSMNNSTIALNHASNRGGGVSTTYSITVANSIIAGNYDDSNPSGTVDCQGPITSLGHNLIQGISGTCQVTGATGSDIYAQPAQLAPLSSGDATPVMPLLSTSPAIDAGDAGTPGSGGTACAAADQRGILRPQGSRCDIGAFERSATLSITGILPSHAANGAVAEAVIAGSGMLDGATVKLQRSGQSDIPGTLTTVQGGNSSVTAVFDLTGKAAGNWDVVVTNMDGTTTTLPGGFAIDASGATRVWTEVIGPTVARPGSSPPFFVSFGNRGNLDALDVPIMLSVPANVALKLKFLVQPPPSQPGQVATESSLLPMYGAPGPESGFLNVSLLVPVIPAGYTGSLRFSLTLPGTLNEGDSFVFYATPGEPLLQPGVDSSAVVSELAAAAIAYAQAKLGVTVPASKQSAVQQYAANQLQYAVDNGRAGFSATGGAAIPIYSLAQMNIDAALFAASQANNQPAAPLFASFAKGGLDAASKRPTLQSHAGGDFQVCVANGEVFYIRRGDIQPGGSSCKDPDISVPPPPCAALQKSTAANPCLPSQPGPFTPSDCNNLPRHHVTGNGALCVPDKGNHCAIFTNPLGPTGDCTIIPIKTSVDPNAKFGPLGPGPQQYHTSGNSFNYTVEFENQPTASLPAQQVVVTDHLDTTNLDASTFSLGPISVGSQTVIPPAGTQQFTGALDLRPDQNVIVKIDAGLNLVTGVLTWRFLTLDPDTEQLTTDPASGFLPPNVTPPQGQGLLLYSIAPKSGLASGTTICNQATVVFDANAPINTQNWCNTIDDSAPTSSVSSLPMTETTASFPVQWSGSDTGSGINDYTIYVSDDGGSYTPWLSETTLTQSMYPGVAGHSYAFYSIARDTAYNLESAKLKGDTVTIVSNTSCPPGSCFLVSASPSSGFASIGVPYPYAFAYTDASGSAALQQVGMRIGSSSAPGHACSAAWYRSDHTIRLYDDTGSGSYAQGPDTGGSLSNSQCTVTFDHPITESGNNLSMALGVSFTQSFAGNKYIYMQAQDNTPTSTGLQLMGTVNIATSTPCDVNGSQSTDAADVQMLVGEALGSASSVHDLNRDHVVNVLDVQIVVNAASKLVCTAL